MKLYSYDHCPFCVRARMIFGVHRIAFEHIILKNDDEVTPKRLIGKKMVPILVKEDGSAMGESMDIVRYIDGQADIPILTKAVREEVQEWAQKVGKYYNHLTMPRMMQIGLAEFSTQSAKDYFIQKKTEFIGDFAQNLAESQKYIEQIQADFVALEGLMMSAQGMNGKIDEEDFFIFPILRSLTVVKNLGFPKNISAYLEKMSAQVHVPLFLNQAL